MFDLEDRFQENRTTKSRMFIKSCGDHDQTTEGNHKRGVSLTGNIFFGDAIIDNEASDIPANTERF